MNLDETKLAKLAVADDMLEEAYGKPGSSTRKEFEGKAEAWYYAELLKEARKKNKITQKQLAEMIGKKREYIVLLERGETDMQLSTFLNITHALGLRFGLIP
ncbi:HTH-type transcriptional regulator/antitoxin HipB [Parabacteroides sp. PFB2-10]|uniref:helix-turn-helix transcriptional regulator n=1 Tax=Parabacteroides sp. PFB2-10 TaxID=1742405 RepID=UPI002473DC9B|nr:helix-turn-helix transcriptional regulator [Parabacteroides sp. PFB2-10]MDH6312235.1 HTH-type transcriptional regulator/antitoxin HipB [Parabacteroides sp. PFB2-10]